MWNDVKVLKSTDENVLKYVFEQPGAIVESVLYKYPTYEDRTVICCSTQCGCPIGCRFCGTGEYFVRSLTADEIVSQPQRCLEDTGIDVKNIKKLQIMFMSMGEPMLNTKHLIDSMRRLHEMYPQALLLISTSGPDVDYEPIMQISEEIPTIGLQFSVHETTDEARNKLIPFKKKLTLWDIADKGVEFLYVREEHHSLIIVRIQTILVKMMSIDCTSYLTLRFGKLRLVLSVNETISVAHKRQRDMAEGFEKKLRLKGFRTRVFDPAGQDDIGGGCGQLVFIQRWMKDNPEFARKTVGYNLPIVHTPQE